MRHNKRQLAGFLALVSVVGLVICGVLVLTQVIPDFRASASEEYREEWTLAISEGENVRIDVSGIHVRISLHDGDEAAIRFVGAQRALGQERPKLFADRGAGGIEIVQRNHESRGWKLNLGPFGYASLSGELTILLPRREYGDLQVGTFSGNINVQDLEAKNITLDASSGKIETSGLTADRQLTFQTFSGSQTHTGLRAETCDIDASSGSVTLRDSELKTLTIETFSGSQTLSGIGLDKSITLDSSSGRINADLGEVERATFHTFSGGVTLRAESIRELNADSSSGGIDVTLREEPERVTLEAFSGAVSLKLPRDSEFTYTIETFSGRVNIDFPHTQNEDGGVVAGGKNKVDVQTSSGSIRIEPL